MVIFFKLHRQYFSFYLLLLLQRHSRERESRLLPSGRAIARSSCCFKLPLPTPRLRLFVVKFNERSGFLWRGTLEEFEQNRAVFQRFFSPVASIFLELTRQAARRSWRT